MAGTIGDANNAMKNLSSSTNATTDSLFKLQDTLKNLVPNKMFESALNINQQIVNLNREVLQRGPETVRQLEKVLTDTTMATLEFGVSIEDNIDLFSKLNQSLQRTNFFTKNQIIDMQLIARNTGLAADEMAKFEEAFDTLGLSTDYMIDNLEDMSNMARNYGLNVNQFMGVIADNVKLLAGYNFKNGIDGLSEMVARAQSLRFDFGKTVELADKLMDPEQAIEMAASFQMMGGEIGKLGDPMQMLYMAQQDMGGLQDSIMEAAASAVSFNKETGKFDIPVTQMYRLRTMADQLGMSYSDLAEQAMRSKQEQEKLSVIEGLGTIPMEYQELVKNLSEFDTEGELKIKLPNMDDSIEVSRLTAGNFKELRDLQELEGKSQKQIADDQLSVQEEILAQISKIEFQPGAALLTEGRDAVVGITSSLKTFYGATSDFIEENLGKMISTSETVITEYIESIAQIDLKRLASEEGYADKVFNQMLDAFKTEELKVNSEKTNVYGKEGRVITGEEVVTETPQNNNNGEVRPSQVKSELSDTTSAPPQFIDFKALNPNSNNTVADFKFNQPIQISLDVNVRGNQMAANEIANIIRTDTEIQGNLKTLIKDAINDSSTAYG